MNLSYVNSLTCDKGCSRSDRGGDLPCYPSDDVQKYIENK